MQILSQPQAIELLDSLACALLSAAATCRARNFGANMAGAVALGCMIGLISPLLREVILHAQNGPAMILAALPDDALTGSLGAILALLILKNQNQKLFLWLDAASIGLAGTLATALGARELGFVGALALGMAAGLAPSAARDCILGDVALLVDENWYAASLLLGCLCVILILLAPILGAPLHLLPERLGEWAIISGACLVIIIRLLANRQKTRL